MGRQVRPRRAMLSKPRAYAVARAQNRSREAARGHRVVPRGCACAGTGADFRVFEIECPGKLRQAAVVGNAPLPAQCAWPDRSRDAARPARAGSSATSGPRVQLEHAPIGALFYGRYLTARHFTAALSCSGKGSETTGSSPRLGKAGWARCTGPSTSSWAGRRRSRSCCPSSRPGPTSSGDFSTKPARPPGCSTRPWCRSTIAARTSRPAAPT